MGDDAALVRPSRGHDLVVAVDAQVEDIHFQRRWSLPGDIGWRALAVNLSDLAAMGARPLACLSSLAAPPGWSDRELLAVHQGLIACGRKFRCPLIGGNISSTSRGSGLELHVTVLGEVPQGRALLRSGARPGDDIWVSGKIGEAATGLAALRKSGRRASSRAKRYLRPVPRLALGEALRKTGKIHAAIDVSDGLLADLNHLLDNGKRLGAYLELAEIPFAPFPARLTERSLLQHQQKLLSAGDDYELLFCAPPDAAAAIKRAAHSAHTMVCRIGKIEKRTGLRLATTGDNVLEYRGPKGWLHR